MTHEDIDKDDFITLYQVPPEQRATLWVWLKHVKCERVMHTFHHKRDEIGLVDGCIYSDYVKWHNQWNGYVFFPAMYLESQGKSLTAPDCDKLLVDEEGNLLPDKEEIMLLKEDLISFMVHPFRHDKVTLMESGNTHTYYEANKALDVIFPKAMKNPFMVKLYNRKLEVLREVTNGILLSRYNYKNTFYR